MKKKSEIDLQVHPYFKAYGLEKVIQVMYRNGLDVVALEYLNKSVFQEVQTLSSELKNKGYRVDSDSLAIRIENENKKFYLLKAIELWTKENFHLLTIGCDNILPYQPMRKMIDKGLEQDALVIFDHPLANSKNVGREITLTKRREAIKICKEYSGHLALEWNGYCIPGLRKVLGGRDVNSDVIKLSENLSMKEYNIPVVADTDLHARSKRALKAMGTARIKSELDLTSGRSIIDSLKEDIFFWKHEKVYKTVSLTHFMLYFALPYVFEKFFERARG